MRVFRKTGVSTLINILGMSVAFAAAMILLVRVYWDETYDRKLKGSEQVFRMEQDWSESGRFSVYFKRPLIERVRQMDPNIESVATMASWGNWTLAPEGNPGAGVSLSRAMVDETFFDVFPLTWLDGSVKEFATPSTVVLNRTMARTFFGDEPAVGKYLQNGDGTRFRVVGVYEDMPANSSIAHQSFINLGEQYLEDEGEWSFSAYLKLRDPKEAKATQARVTESLLEYFGGNAEDATDEDRDEFRREFRISNLHKAYFLQDMYPSVSTVNKSMTITLLAIALLLIVIAIINFINFSFAEIPFRIKSINTRKVLGASRRSLIRSLLLRAAVLALVAFGLSCLFLRVVAGTSWASGVAESMTVRDYVAIILPMLGVTLCAAVVAGLAPALYSTSQPAALVLKGSYAMSFKGKTLRNALVGLQFVLSFVFILLGLYVDAQLRFMKNKDMGFRQENVLQVGCSQRAGGQLEALKGQLLQNPSILAVTASDNVIVGESRMSWGRRADDGTQVNMEVLPVADDFIDFFGLQIVDGRDFLPSDTQSESGCFIVNEAFMQRYPQFHVGSYIEGHETMSPIVGVVKDFYSKSLHHGVEPLVLYNWGSDPWRNHGVLYIRVAEGADFKAVSDYVKNTICSLDPALTPSQLNVRRLGEWIGSLYVVESVLHKLVTIASIVALLIAIIGIIGLVFFETQFLRKEIAVRRVNGATVSSILQMINKKYLLIACLSFVVAAPIAFFLMTGWRQGFVSQAPISVWIFVAALTLVAVISAAVVTLQSLQAANANPVESLKNE
jgi:ABC-type antimicrobial peptide transport system, permease component